MFSETIVSTSFKRRGFLNLNPESLTLLLESYERTLTGREARNL